MAEKKEIKDMDIQELRDELKLYCSRCRNCRVCVLSVLHHTGDEAADHPAFEGLNSRFMLDTMVALARGYLEWKHSYIDPNDPTVDHEKLGSNVPEQPTVPPMPEPVKSAIGQAKELTVSMEGNLLVDGYADATQIVISGKKPTSMTVFYDQEGGGD